MIPLRAVCLRLRLTRPLGWVLSLLAAVPGANGADSIVLAWNAALLDAVRAETTPPPLAVRNLAIAHLVMEDAAQPGAGRREVMLPVSAGIVSSALFPGRRALFEHLRDQQLADIAPAPTADEWSRAMTCATRFLEERRDDGASRSVTYIPQSAPGQWRRTAPFFRPPELPQWPLVRTFAVTEPARLVPAGPPSLESTRWNAALEEISRLGARASTERTSEQRLIARFWSDFSYTTTPPGHWNEIAAVVARARHLDDRETAHLFAVLNVAMADAGIVCWQAKYRYNFWRPITALAEDNWQPLLNTPAHPEYPSGHSTFSGAAAAVLAAFVGSDECDFTVRSDAVPGAERTFHRFSDAALEISLSRVYAGIHYRFSCEDGLVIGRAVAADVLQWDRQRCAAAASTEVAVR